MQSSVRIAAAEPTRATAHAAERASRRVVVSEAPPLWLIALERIDLAAMILTLFGCVLAFGEPLSAAYAALGVLAVAVASRLVTPPALQETLASGSVPARATARVLVEWLYVVGALLLVGFALKVSDWYSRGVVLSWIAFTPLALVASQELQVRMARWVNLSGALATRYVIVGANAVGRELARRLPPRPFHGWFDFRAVARDRAEAEREAVADCRTLGDYVRANGIGAVYIALPMANAPRMRELLADLRDTTASVYFVPDVFAFDLIQARVVDVNGMPALAVCDTPLRGTDAFSKRLLDLLFACGGLLVLSPLLLAIALAVKLGSRGPVLFSQRRYGLAGEEIVIHKFRTMTVCEDGAQIRQASADDARITTLGRFLRRTSLDELPQLVNVVQGKMSLVGPRPHAVAHNELYRRRISGYMLRHKVRPGLTGWAQVHGLRGATDTVDKMEERVRYDLEYLNNWSLLLDLRILFRTVVVVLRGDNAY